MSERQATLYRMVTPDHLCPFGIKSKALLERQGFEVNDHRLATREQTDQCDLESFTNQFITYDLLGMRWPRYAYFYPFGEAIWMAAQAT